MKKKLAPVLLALLFVVALAQVLLYQPWSPKHNAVSEVIEKAENGDYFFMQHSYPNGRIAYAAHRAASVAFNQARTNTMTLKPTGIPEWKFAGQDNIKFNLVGM